MTELIKFRKLTADELEARVATVSEKGCSVLIYKNARVDMAVLDETVGPMNWQRNHREEKGNLFCGIGIYDNERSQWVWKWDCGAESFTEKEKGEASDSFKRAGFNWGIGRELYTCPFIWFNAVDINMKQRNGKWTTYDHFKVTDIAYEDNKVSRLVVVNEKTGAQFAWSLNEGTKRTGGHIEEAPKVTDANVKNLIALARRAEISLDEICLWAGVEDLKYMTKDVWAEACRKLQNNIEKRGKRA